MTVPITREFEGWNGTKYFVEGNYLRASRGKGHKLMHVAIWEFVNGPVPDGYQLHHIDGDSSHNWLQNLQLVTPKEHCALHEPRGCFFDTPEKRSAMRKVEWARKQPRVLLCAQCGKLFRSTGQRAKFCSRRCRGKSYQ
jgi:hypothetical protein